jgi:SCY1-like protein 2
VKCTLTRQIFEKKQLEKLSKPDQEQALKLLRRDPSNLSKLRHPYILQVHSALEETKSQLVFQTEPILASLANVLG